jgi:hypothetical protein
MPRFEGIFAIKPNCVQDDDAAAIFVAMESINTNTQSKHLDGWMVDGKERPFPLVCSSLLPNHSG